MGGYFKPWRRKFGVVTLVFACVFMVGWIRGLVVEDVWQPATGKLVDQFHQDTVQHIFRFSQYGMTWQRSEGLDGGKFGWQPGWGTNSASAAKTVEEKIEKRFAGNMKWRWRWWGFDFYESEMDERRYTRRRIPYWSIAIPLTLFSAYLLLGNPRSTKFASRSNSSGLGNREISADFHVTTNHTNATNQN